MNKWHNDTAVLFIFKQYVADKNVLYTWGKNTEGCLGLGHRDDQYFPFMVSAY